MAFGRGHRDGRHLGQLRQGFPLPAERNHRPLFAQRRRFRPAGSPARRDQDRRPGRAAVRRGVRERAGHRVQLGLQRRVLQRAPRGLHHRLAGLRPRRSALLLHERGRKSRKHRRRRRRPARGGRRRAAHLRAADGQGPRARRGGRRRPGGGPGRGRPGCGNPPALRREGRPRVARRQFRFSALAGIRLGLPRLRRVRVRLPFLPLLRHAGRIEPEGKRALSQLGHLRAGALHAAHERVQSALDADGALAPARDAQAYLHAAAVQPHRLHGLRPLLAALPQRVLAISETCEKIARLCEAKHEGGTR